MNLMVKERILVFGLPGSGKSYSWLSTALAYPNKKFYVIDTDSAVERMMTTEFTGLKNIELYSAPDWLSCCKALDTIKTKITSNDWLVIDLLCSTWSMVQNYFVSEIFRKDAGDYFLQIRKEMKAGSSSLSVLKGWTDWVTINRMYEDFINLACYQLPCNVFFCCKASKLNAEDDAETKDVFSQFGCLPGGEKKNIYRVHTVLLLAHDKHNYYLTTVKDRGRIRVENMALTPEANFAVKYLQMIAGWEKEL
jgi:hypothetical protein